MENIKKWLNKKGYKFEEIKMQDGEKSIFINIDSIKKCNDIKKYINKYTGLKFEYRCNYTVLRVF